MLNKGYGTIKILFKENIVYPATPVVTPSTSLVTVTAGLTSVDGKNYYQSIWPLISEAFSVQL
jgi:hypothetical protein